MSFPHNKSASRLLLMAASSLAPLGVASANHEASDFNSVAGSSIQALYEARCANCHGEDGIGHSDSSPNLAGQKRAYTESELFAFKYGRRGGVAMPQIAARLTDRQIRELSVYIADLGTCTTQQDQYLSSDVAN